MSNRIGDGVAQTIAKAVRSCARIDYLHTDRSVLSSSSDSDPATSKTLVEDYLDTMSTIETKPKPKSRKRSRSAAENETEAMTRESFMGLAKLWCLSAIAPEFNFREWSKTPDDDAIPAELRVDADYAHRAYTSAIEFGVAPKYILTLQHIPDDNEEKPEEVKRRRTFYAIVLFKIIYCHRLVIFDDINMDGHACAVNQEPQKANNRLMMLEIFIHKQSSPNDVMETHEKPIICTLSAHYAYISFAIWFIFSVEQLIPGKFLKWHDEMTKKDNAFASMPAHDRINAFVDGHGEYLEKMYQYLVNACKTVQADLTILEKAMESGDK